MARSKKTPTTATNGDRVTNRDLMTAVQGIHTRIDDVNKRVDESLDGQRELSGSMTKLHVAMHDLREVTNDRLHGLEADIETLKRPWKLMQGGWRKAVVAAGGATAITGLIAKFVEPGWLPF